MTDTKLDTRKYYCYKCSKVVAQIIKGSKLKKGTIFICAECNSVDKPKYDRSTVPDFMKTIFGDKL